MRILQPNYEKSVGKESVGLILARTLKMKRQPAGAPSARVLAGLPTLSP